MNTKKQENTKNMPKELQKLIPYLNIIPQKLIEKQFQKTWKKKTKILDNPEKNTKKITQLQTQQTKKLEYQGKKVYDWLEEIKNNQKNKETKKFITWYKKEYYKISLKDLGIFQ